MPLLIVILLCLIIGALGKDRLFGFWGFFFLSLLLTPLVGTMLLLLMSPYTDAARRAQR